MGINYGIRGGDVMDITQVNNYFTLLEKISNINVVANTKKIEEGVDRQVNSIFFVGADRIITVASVYIVKSGVAAPTTYPAMPVCVDITNNATLTETAIEENTQSFNVNIAGIDYVVYILRKTFSINTTDIYISCKTAPINSIKNLENTKINQFLIWTESRKNEYTRIENGNTSNYSDFEIQVDSFASYSLCLLTASTLLPLQIEFETGRFLTPLSSFFLCDNWTDSYLNGLRFLFKNTTSGTNTFYLMERDQKDPNIQEQDYLEISLNVENVYTFYTEYSIDDIADFRKTINSMKSGLGDNLITLVMRNEVPDGITEFFALCVKAKNENYKMMNLGPQYPLSPASLFPLRQNARQPHVNCTFQGNIGDGERPDVNSNLGNKFRISFENGLIDLFTNQFNYTFYNGYSILFGVGRLFNSGKYNYIHSIFITINNMMIITTAKRKTIYFGFGVGCYFILIAIMQRAFI